MSVSKLSRISLPLPPLAEQHRIVEALQEYLSRLDAGKSLLEDCKSWIQVLRSSLAEEILGKVGSFSTLRDVLLEPLVNGRSVPTADVGAPVLRLTALFEDRVNLDERKTGAWSLDEATPFFVQKDDFLVARGNGSLRLVGRGSLVRDYPDSVAFPDTMIRVRADPSKIALSYLCMAWNSPIVRRQIEATARTTAGIYKVNQRTLESISIPLPDVETQREMAHALTSAVERKGRVLDAVEVALRRQSSLRAGILREAFAGRLVARDPNSTSAFVLPGRIRERQRQAPVRQSRWSSQDGVVQTELGIEP